MKRFFIIVLATVVLGCRNETDEKSEIEIGMDYGVYRRSFIMYFCEPEQLELSNYPNSDNLLISFKIPLEELYGCYDIGRRQQLYDALCEKYGDMTYNREGVEWYIGDAPSTTADGFVSIEIVSDADYDETHPAGSSLGDVFTFFCLSFKPYIDSGYTPYKLYIDGTFHSNWKYYPVEKMVSELTPDDLTLLFGRPYNIQGSFRPESLPTLSKEHTFTVTFTDEKGLVLSDSIEMSFD